MTHGPARRILFIGLNYSPEEIGIGPYSTGLVEALAARGHEVRAVVGQPYYPEWERQERYKGGWKTSVENGVEITRCPHYVPANPTGKRRMAHHLSFASSAYPSARLARSQHRPDLVLTVAPSMIAVPVAIRMARRAGVPLWLHVQDFEVGAALATGLIERDSKTALAAARFEQRMLSAADMVSTISARMCELAEAKGVPAERIVELRNWANHAHRMADADGDRLRREWSLEGKTIALYAGNIGNKQGLEIILDAARVLADRPDIAFVIAGTGPGRARLAKAAAGLPNVQLRGKQPDAVMGDMLTMADIHLLPQLPDAADLVLPSKIGNMLASGRPIVATAAKGTGIDHELDGCGVVVPPLDVDALAWSIRQLTDDPDLRRRLGHAGQRRAALKWSRDGIIDTFEAQMQLLLG